MAHNAHSYHRVVCCIHAGEDDPLWTHVYYGQPSPVDLCLLRNCDGYKYSVPLTHEQKKAVESYTPGTIHLKLTAEQAYGIRKL